MDVGQGPWAEYREQEGMPTTQYQTRCGGGTGRAAAARSRTPLSGSADAFRPSVPSYYGDAASSSQDRQRSPLGGPGFPVRMPRAYIFYDLIFYVAECLYALRDFVPPRGSGCNRVSPPCRAGRIATSLNAAGAPTRRHRWASMPCGRRILFDQVCRNVAQPYASAS